MHDDFAVEPIKGLPEVPPKGEQILWQGQPDWWALTKASLGFWWVMGYFAFLALWRAYIRPVETCIKGVRFQNKIVA